MKVKKYKVAMNLPSCLAHSFIIIGHSPPVATMKSNNIAEKKSRKWEYSPKLFTSRKRNTPRIAYMKNKRITSESTLKIAWREYLIMVIRSSSGFKALNIRSILETLSIRRMRTSFGFSQNPDCRVRLKHKSAKEAHAMEKSKMFQLLVK